MIEGKVIDVHPSPSLHLSPAALKSFLTRILQQNASMRACPAPKFPIEGNDCSLPTCHEDKDCLSKNQSCCFNGCIFTCIERISPPPVIDWEEEPQPPQIREEGAAVLRCTTSPRPAPSEPVGCPKGYVCRIDNHLDPLEGFANIGVCVPETPNDLDPEIDDESGIKEKTIKQTVYLPGGCVLSETQYKHMQDFKKRSYVVDCFCNDGNVECQISSKKE